MNLPSSCCYSSTDQKLIIGEWCSGSTAEFDSASDSSILSSPSKFLSRCIFSLVEREAHNLLCDRSNRSTASKHGTLAQLVEQWIHIPCVGDSSSPSTTKTNARVTQLVECLTEDEKVTCSNHVSCTKLQIRSSIGSAKL